MSALGVEDVRLRDLLDERSALLARRGLEQSRTGETTDYLVCACTNERVGIALTDVAGVSRARTCTPIPGAPRALRGIIAVSGAIVSVIDLALALDLPRTEEPASGHLLRLRAQEPPIALTVERVLGLTAIDEDAFQHPTGTAGALRTERGLGGDAVVGYAPPGSGRGLVEGFSVLDVRQLLRRYFA